MSVQQIPQPKLSDVIEQQLEFLILRGRCAPVKSSRLNANWQNSSTFRPPLREAIQRLEAKGLLLRRQEVNVCTKPPAELQRPAGRSLSDHPNPNLDLLGNRVRAKRIAAYYAALRSSR